MRPLSIISAPVTPAALTTMTRIQIDQHADVSHIRVIGRLDANAMRALTDRILCRASRRNRLEIDLSGVDTFDSAGFQGTLRIRREADRCGIPLRFVGHNFLSRELVDLHDRMWSMIAPETAS